MSCRKNCGKMNKFWHHTHKSSTDSVTSITGFHDGYVYKIVNKKDDSVVELEHYKTLPGAVLIAAEDLDNDAQKFKTTRIREGESGGEFEIQSVHQDPQGSRQVWEYRQDEKILIQNTETPVSEREVHISILPSPSEAHPIHNFHQLWIAVEKVEGSRVYFIKPLAENVCLTNVGVGKPIELHPPNPEDTAQHWILDPIDYVE